MPADQIYVLEAVIYQLELEPAVTVQHLEQLTLNFKFSQRVNFDIDSQHFTAPQVENNSNGKNIDMNYGKTFLFVAKPNELRQLLQIEPFQITILEGTTSIGTTVVPWKKEFAEMVKFFDTIGIVKSTTTEEWFQINDDNGQKVGQVNMFIRMSCFGSNVQTTFQIKKGEEQKQEFIFRSRNISKTFKIDRYQDEISQPLIAPMYGAVTDPKSAPESQVNMRENTSLTQLFDRDITPKLSTYQGPDEGEGINLDFGQDYDIVSMCFRPSENKFFDFLNAISANVATHGKGTCVTLQKNKVSRADSFLKSVGGTIKQSTNIIEDDEDNPLHTTAEQINKKLCGNKDCPAVRKFKEYGIGPLATGNNLGTFYGDVEPPVLYGMTHAYGTMLEYGPYGAYARPKQEELPFVPLEPISEPVKPCKMRKLTDTTGVKSSKKEKKKKPQWHSQTCPLCPDRLRGGSDEGQGFGMNNEFPVEEEGTVMPKSPMIECKSVMDQFDSILAEYKKAIGPCGHATCPYAQTLAEDACKKACELPSSGMNKTSSMSCNDVPCDFEECPYGEDTKKKKRYPAGCGNPRCAYTKYKLGLVDEDAELELQFLPPAIGGNCGSPRCKYPVEPPLPPIHWDCPDPLPKGPCKNLNCPFQPRPLRKIKTKQQIKTGPCGSPMCPYALPQPCGVPTCPFTPRPCPMNEAQNQQPQSEEDGCENPDCPFAKPKAENEVPDEIEDPNITGEFQDCANPDCPYKNKDKKKKSKKKGKGSACANPNCPLNKSSKKDKKKKKKKCTESADDINVKSNNNCDNPCCPFNTKDNKKNGKSKSDESVCPLQECPYSKKKEKNRCLESSSDSVSICSDDDCPYAQLKMLKKQGKGDADADCERPEGDSLCSNPNCPERLERGDPNTCPIPGCPYSQNTPKSNVCQDPNCPYLQPLPSCGIPNCPYEPIPVRFNCKNPVCPSHKVDFSRKKDQSKPNLSAEQANDLKQGTNQGRPGGDNTALVLQTTTVCEDTVNCEQPDDCENPDCEVKDAKPRKNGQETTAVEVKKKKGKRKNKGKFVYSIGDSYPSTKLGHKECVMPVFNVPPHMGWLWNIFTPVMRLKPRRGWRPGALTRTIAARIRAHRQAKGLGQVKIPIFKVDGTAEADDGGDPKVSPKPTLQIQKKDGAYWITMNPLKDPYSLVENEDPYMDCTPMTFKITKNKKPEDEYCYCDGGEPPENLSSSSDSELDIEFTPPAGIIHPERFKKRPNIVCCDTQYDPKDFEVQKKEKGKKDKGKDKKGKGGKGGKGGKKKK